MSNWRVRRTTLALTGAVTAMAAMTLTASLMPAGAAVTGARPATARPAPARSSAGGLRPACPVAPAGYARCFALYRPQTSVNRAIAAGVTGKRSEPHGLTPAEIEHAYRLPISRNSQQTVAVSIAFHTPHLADYLAAYRRHFGLPPCTVRSGCFRQVNQNGKASPLAPSGVGSGWDLEVTLDVSMISVACPSCKIIVVEGKNPSIANLARTDKTAARLGADVISNSYGARENGEALTFARAYSHPGHTVVASTGDFGYTAANFPADLGSVTAVGGTVLQHAHNKRGWSERAWADGSSGCSAYVRKPSWQHDAHCPGRTDADISAVAADVPIFNKVYGGWVTVAGTSIAAPLVSGIFGLAGNGSTIRPGYAYSHRQFLFDITRGGNAVFETTKQACGDDYLCVARKGYDAPTGLGSPNGIGGF